MSSELFSGADEPVSPTRSPGWLLAVAAVAVLIGAGLAVPGETATAVAGYATSSLVAFTVVALFRRGSRERQLLHGIAQTRSQTLLAASVLVAGFVVSVIHAWTIATEVATR
jgi:hypothetical protein